MPWKQAIPALPVRELHGSLVFYKRIGFEVGHTESGFAVLTRDAVGLHLWVANDDGWRKRLGEHPVMTGAESFLAGTASCRIEVTEVDALHAKLAPLGVSHPDGPLQDQWWGVRDFAVVDPDGNLVTFYETTGRRFPPPAPPPRGTPHR